MRSKKYDTIRNKGYAVMRLLYAAFFVLFLFSRYQPEYAIPVKGYMLTWSDEFDGKDLDKTKWDYRALGKRDDAYITRNAVMLDGAGHLIIKAFHKNDSVFTGMISTENIFEKKYGYFECRVKLTHTPGTFPAFWLQSHKINEPNSTPDKNGAEIDIFEYYPHANINHVSHALHWGGYGAGHKVEGPVWGELSPTPDDFHVIGFEWTENSYATFVDGKQTYSGNQLISHIPEFIILSLGINTLAAGPVSVKDLPDQFIVDYVRVYEKK